MGSINNNTGFQSNLKQYSVLDYGALGDGTTDNTTALNTAVTAVNTLGGGILYFPTGNYKTTGPIVWKSYVYARGSGAVNGSRIFGSGNFGGHAIIEAFGTVGSEIKSIGFQDIEIDGLLMTESGYNVADKGIFLQCVQDMTIERCYVHDTPATGIGCDFLQRCRIVNNRLYGGGRLATSGSNIGGSNIGVGVGAYDVEDTLVQGNTIDGNISSGKGNYGIFFELQGDPTTAYNSSTNRNKYAQGARVIGNTLINCYKGISDAGCRGLVIANNSLTGCGVGIAVDSGTISAYTGYEGQIVNNYVLSTVAEGILVDVSFHNNNKYGYTVANNTISTAGTNGISAKLNVNNFERLSVRNNDVYMSGNSGILLTTAGAGVFKNLQVTGNRSLSNGTASTTTYDGLRVDAGVTVGDISNNVMADTQGSPTQRYGLVFISASRTYSSLNVQNNAFAGNVTAAFNGLPATLSLSWFQNTGVPTIGPASISVGASPYTYTAGQTPEIVYITGGTITSIVRGGVTLSTVSPCTVLLNPAQGVVVTYAVAPTMVKDIK